MAEPPRSTGPATSAPGPDGPGPAGRSRQRGWFDRLHSLLRTVVAAGVVVVLGWWTLFFRDLLHERDRVIEQRDQQIAGLVQDVEKLELRTRELEAALRLLKVDHRVARLTVLSQLPLADRPGAVETRLRFEEIDAEGRPIAPARELAVEGRLVYVDALVIKFEDSYVERGDFLRGTSICLFRRIFGEHQKPLEGAPLDASGALPAAYTGGDAPEPLYADLWQRFWDYANDPELAASKGVRAAHGEAPFVETRPGATYRIELRASGGLSIRLE